MFENYYFSKIYIFLNRECLATLFNHYNDQVVEKVKNKARLIGMILQWMLLSKFVWLRLWLEIDQIVTLASWMEKCDKSLQQFDWKKLSI